MRKTLSEAVEVVSVPILFLGIDRSAIPIIAAGVLAVVLAYAIKPRSKEPFESYTLVAALFFGMAVEGFNTLQDAHSVHAIINSVIELDIGINGFAISTAIKAILMSTKKK